MNVSVRIAIAACILAACGGEPPAATQDVRPPNIVLVITDDQGYGDIGAHGNTMIRTPHLDKLHGESVRLTNFHVDPTCSPTRSALMTGRYSSSGGGVQQTPDYWGNDYFDDTYWTDGVPTKYEGYCTDVWFDQALAFIETNRNKPFFAYVATNAPHGPYLVDEKYSKPYADQGVPSPMAEFYGMIENVDGNLGRLDAKLAELGLRENTVLIFMTDNGTAAGVANPRRPAPEGSWAGFNDGMRGQKGSEYEGGHRVPFFVRWPAGGLGEARDVATLAAHIDVLPTLAEMAGVTAPAELDLDGKSLLPLLRSQGEWPDRTLAVHSQRIDFPERWRKSAVMTQQWRLINGEELYDMQADPGQQRDVAGDHPDVKTRLRESYDAWWARIDDRFDDYVRIPIGAAENPARITAHDWHPEDGADGSVPWNQPVIQRDPVGNGYWMIDVAEPGAYELELFQWDKPAGKKLDAATARVVVGDVAAQADVPAGATSVKLELELPAGPAKMQTWLKQSNGKERGAFFVYAKKL